MVLNFHDDEEDFVDHVQTEWRGAYPNARFRPATAAARIVRIALLLEEKTAAAIATLGLTRGESEVLCAIARSAKGALKPKAIKPQVFVSPGGLTARLAKLEEKGCLVRLPDSDDRRGAIFQATEKGRALALEAHQLTLSVEHKLLSALDGEEIEILNLRLKAILSNAEKDRS